LTARTGRLPRRLRRARALCLVTGFIVEALGCLPAARAKDNAELPMLVVPVTVQGEGAEAVQRLATLVERALSRRKVPVHEHAKLGEFVEERHSRAAAPEADVETLHRLSQVLHRSVVTERFEDALRVGDELRTLFEHSLETLNRNNGAAKEHFQACTDHVRALLALRPAEAPSRARQCRAENLDAKVDVHDASPPKVRGAPTEVQELTPEVQELIRQVDAEPVRTSVHVESQGRVCPVFINGRPVGETPPPDARGKGVFVTSVPRGEVYRIQVECDPSYPARVHAARAGLTPITIQVNAEFERALRTEDGALWLDYEVMPSELPLHVRELQKVVTGRENPDGAIAVSLEPGGRRVNMRLTGVQRGGGIYLDLPTNAATIEAAVATLLDAPTTDEALRDAQQNVRVQGAFSQHPTSRRQTLALAAATAFSATGGAVALGIGWSRFQRYSQHGDALVGAIPGTAPYAADFGAWRDDRRAFLAWSGASAALWTVSMGALAPLVPAGRPRQIASPVLFLGGTSLLAYGLHEIKRGAACTSEDAPKCVDSERKRLHGIALTLASVPLLTMPLVHFALWRRDARAQRADAGSAHQLAFQVTPRSAKLAFSF
jgi:hypothetical protein